MMKLRALRPLLAALCLAAVCGQVRARAEPIRIGLLTVKNGPLAAPGKQLEDGFNFLLKERGGMLAGRKIEVVSVDTSGQPAQARSKTQELIERHKVKLIVGPLASTEALAIDDTVRDAQIPLISPSALAEDMTQRKRNPWVVRATATTGQFSHPLGEYAAKTLGYRRAVTIASDFAYGHEAVAGFQRVFEESGGKVVRKLWVPVAAVDFGGFITQIRDADVVFASFSGASAQSFLRQYNEYGLKGLIPVLTPMSMVDESLLAGMGSDAAGVISAGFYSAALETPAGRQFAAAYTKAHGVAPGFYSTGAYVAGLFVEEALRAVKGNIEDKPAFMKALRSVRLKDSPRGELWLDEYGNPVGSIYIRRTEAKNGQMQNTVIKTYPQQSQFWTYGAEKFLAQPVYSRDYPPARYLEN